VVVCVGSFPALELGIDRKDLEPRLGGVAHGADVRARVGEKQPTPLLVVAEDVGHQVRPAREELRRQAGLEGLDRTALLEPNDSAGHRHAKNRRPRSLVGRLDGRDGHDMVANPVLCSAAIHASTITK
jgi:hypothetical protein